MTMQPDDDLPGDIDDLRQRLDDAEWDAEGIQDDVEGVHSEVIAQGEQLAQLRRQTAEMHKRLLALADLYAGMVDAFELTLAEIASEEGSKMAAKKLIEWKSAHMKAARKAVTP